MASEVLNEGHSTFRPPYFNINGYNYSKVGMKIYLKSFNHLWWKKGYELPTMIAEGVKLPKPEAKWDGVDMEQDTLNAKEWMPWFVLLAWKNSILSNCETTKKKFGYSWSNQWEHKPSEGVGRHPILYPII